MYIIGRISIFVLFSTATGRYLIECIPKIPACGPFKIGVDIKEPNVPPFVIVNVLSCISANESLFSLAFFAISAMSLSISAKFLRSASRTTGTTRPLSVDTAIQVWNFFQCSHNSFRKE